MFFLGSVSDVGDVVEGTLASKPAKIICGAGMFCSIIVIISCASSTPVMALAAATAGLAR